MKAVKIAALTMAILINFGIKTANSTYINYTDFTSFQSAVAGSLVNTGFTGFPDGTVITTQYLGIGFEFLGGDNIVKSHSGAIDGTFVYGGRRMDISFSRPIYAIGFHHPGTLGVSLWDNSGGSIIYKHSYGSGGVGYGSFAGIVSDDPNDSFNHVTLVRHEAYPIIDTINFSGPIAVPEPSTTILVGTALFGMFAFGRKKLFKK